ncbi:hypothetical protein EMIHUDRAFT_443728 [Emiliania huxleyi CCMP1516]|uniref:JmjC domain-containing protein n=2 Tax=Emiliania huxleyi TaxID=2903 RepID=A0A0D3JN77_EMIH1|nr:hypothetical protein EMIHUDRAFT_443728 [Emiliania huxleyi CCMP1516]EOD24962.1 hypothetical protein EMIHUDRAFT_443728 [Emiliania huxleyi CCMP1516]|eukprot:XP_005777391.1 hypothetical protein EMIHUDRAFT_443728 [Emiliania huxleyi CCMP1516]
MRRDIGSGIDLQAVRALAEAGGFGPWQRCQLFVGGASAAGARSILHFDQYDNLFVQISGWKRFRVYDPQQTRCLYPFPIHHPLDTRAQVDLEAPDLAAFPRLSEAVCSEVLLGPGQALFLPAYWWHEVVTEPHDGLTVSANFWFAAVYRLLTPTRPLVPSMQCELARQLEYLVSDCLSDRARLVPAFFSALRAAVEAVHAAADARSAAADAARADAAASEALHARRPAGVVPQEWQGLFEYVVRQLGSLVGHGSVLRFCLDLLDGGRFARLTLG